MPVNPIAGRVELGHSIELNNVTQFIRKKRKQVFVVGMRSNRFGEADQ
jgi:hypothetical protein